MAVTINASTSAGLISSADTSGVLQLQTANTTALTIDGSQNVGIGTASPTASSSNRTLTLNSPATFGCVLDLKSNETLNLRIFSGVVNSVLSVKTATPLIFETNDTERIRILSTGEVGIGTSSPSAKLQVSDAGNVQIVLTKTGVAGFDIFNKGTTGTEVGTQDPYPLILKTNNTEKARIDSSGNFMVGTATSISSAGRNTLSVFTSGASTGGQIIVGYNSTTRSAQILGDSAAAYFGSVGNIPVIFRANEAEVFRIDTSNKLLVATTTVIDSARMTIKGSATVINAQTETDGSYVLRVTNAAGSGVGGVVANSSSTSYLTSSDYRLKNTIAPITGALAKVALFKPVTYKWNVDGSDGEGFIAHELAEVCPDAVTGAKDAVDEEGNPKYQGIDTSFLVATLTAALQELNTKFDAYVASHP